MRNIIDYRLGKVIVTTDVLREPSKHVEMFAGMVPFRIKENYASNIYEYYLYCDEFRVIDDGEHYPKYTIIFDDEGNRIITEVIK